MTNLHVLEDHSIYEVIFVIFFFYKFGQKMSGVQELQGQWHEPQWPMTEPWCTPAAKSSPCFWQCLEITAVTDGVGQVAPAGIDATVDW